MGLEWFGFCGSGGFMGIMGAMGVMGIMGVLGGRHCSCCYFRGFYVFDVFVFLLLEECLEAWDVAGAVGRGVGSWCAVGVEPYGVPSGIQCAADVCVGVVSYHKAVAGGAWYFGVEGGGALSCVVVYSAVGFIDVDVVAEYYQVYQCIEARGSQFLLLCVFEAVGEYAYVASVGA